MISGKIKVEVRVITRSRRLAQPGMRTRTLDSSSCRPRLVEDVISPDLPSYREREYLTLVFT